MLRHFKMELKRQQERENQQPQQQQQQQDENVQHAQPLQPSNLLQQVKHQPQLSHQQHKHQQQQRHQEEPPVKPPKQPKRVRGRRSSKPAMEKRRRARINECLDILRSYVLNDTSNLNRLGIDLSLTVASDGTENARLDEDSIAREILKSSGLINRHRGRKNPNKLEKADILELTVDYVRRLHEQRDELLVTAVLAPQHQDRCAHQLQQPQQAQQQQIAYEQVPAHLSEPLTLDLSPKSRLTSTTPPALQAYRPPPNTPLTPPSSTTSSSHEGGKAPFAAAYHQNQVSQMQLLSQVLDGRYKLYEYASFADSNNNNNNNQSQQQ